jgi:hypothetical protein
MTVDRRACLRVLAGSLGRELGSGDARFGKHHTESTRSLNNVLNVSLWDLKSLAFRRPLPVRRAQRSVGFARSS